MEPTTPSNPPATPAAEFPPPPSSAVPTTSTEARCTDFRRICPNCGAELWDKECKSRCPRCRFFSDCSDPW